MVVMHNKTGDLYQLIDDECKAKINGEWIDAVIYHGRDKETGKTKNFVREKSDFNIRFTAVRIIEPDWDDLLMIQHFIPALFLCLEGSVLWLWLDAIAGWFAVEFYAFDNQILPLCVIVNLNRFSFCKRPYNRQQFFCFFSCHS